MPYSIDRLIPEEITDIFQLVKLNGNFANTIFLLAYDKEVVTGALEKQFGTNGKKFIEKIVQVDYTLPNVSEDDLARLFIDSLKHIFHGTDIEQSISRAFENIKEEEFIKLFKSLRDVYRFNNSIKLRLPSIYKELNIRDFFLVEVLRIFKPEAYNFILESKKKLTQSNKNQSIYPSQYSQNKEESKTEFIEKQNLDHTSKKIIGDLFLIDESNFFGITSAEDLIREKRVANINYFDRYFNLQLSNFDIQEDLFNRFIENSTKEQKVEILKKIKKDNRLFQFLKWVEIKSDKTSIKNIESIIISTFSFSDFVHYQREHFNSLDSDFMTLQRFCSSLLDRIKNLNDRRLLIEKHISHSRKKLSFSSYYTINSLLQAKEESDKGELYSTHMWHNLFSDKPEENDEYEKKLVGFYKKAIKIIFQEYLKSEAFLNGSELIFLLPDLKLHHGKYYDKEFKKLISNDKKLLDILILCITRSYMTSGTVVGYQLAKYQLLDGMDIDEIKTRIESMEMKNMDKDEISASKFYLKAYEDGFQENKYYDFYTLEDVGRW